MRVLLRNPKQEVEVVCGRSANRVLDDLELSREAHLVIRNGTLVPGDARVDEIDVIEVRPVISGGLLLNGAAAERVERLRSSIWPAITQTFALSTSFSCVIVKWSRPSMTTTCSAQLTGSWWLLAEERNRLPYGRCWLRPAIRPTAYTSAWESATTPKTAVATSGGLPTSEA